MKFQQYPFSDDIKKNIDRLGFKKPTDIQYKAIYPILKKEDVLAIAQTGTGKTAAFVIPIVHMLHVQKTSRRSDFIKCLVMVPTHELAAQIADVFGKIAQYTKVTSFYIHGGVDQQPQIEKLNKGIDVLIATPGRMFDLISQGYLNTEYIEILVLDEADHMLDLGFINDIRQLVKKLPRKRQTLFFSATINETIKELAYSLVNKPVRIQISPKDPVAKNVSHAVAYIEMDHKRFFLQRVIEENPESKILVFVRTKVRAERVVSALERVGIKSMSLHGDKSQQERNAAMTTFKNGEIKILVATDVSARGIDIPNVEFVINYDLPEKEENYVHRVGRTGRGTHKGIAYSFCSPEEKPLLESIENFITKPIEVIDIDKKDYIQIVEELDSEKNNWQQLINEAEKSPKKKGKKKY